MKKFTIGELDAVYLRRKEIIEKNYHKYLTLCEKGVSENFTLLHTIEVNYVEHVQKTGKKLDGPNALTPILYRKACHYLYSALHLMRYGHMDASYSCIRAAIEHLWQMYFLILAKSQEKELLFKREMNENNPQALLQELKLSVDEEKEIRTKYRHFSMSFMREYLYSKQKRTVMTKLYHQLSLNSHPSVIGMASETEFRAEAVEDLLKVFPLICTGLIAVGVEIYPGEITVEMDNELHLFLDEVGCGVGFLVDFFPDNDDFESRLRIKKEAK